MGFRNFVLFSNRLESLDYSERNRGQVMRMTKLLGTFAAASMIIGVASAADAKDYKVAMVNSGPDGAMTFSPSYLKIAPGDSVMFVAQDKGHNAQSIQGLSPAGAATFAGAMNQNVTVKFTKAGLYGYECLPHFGLGMVGLIQVGPATNKAQFQAAMQKIPPLARARMAKYVARVK
jgi:pseudoazurin